MSKTEDLAKLEKQLKGDCQVCFTKNVPIGLTRHTGRILYICVKCKLIRQLIIKTKEIAKEAEFAERWMGL